MKFSILVPTLNEEKYIGILLDSLVNQTYKNFEVIVFDGKSEDRTRNIVEGYKKKLDLRLLLSDKRNPSYQRNRAVEFSRNDHLVFFDADVKPESLFLEKLYNQIKAGEFQMATSWNVPISDKLVDHLIFSAFNLLYLELFKKYSPGAVGTFIYLRKSVFLDVGGFNEKIILAEDFDLIRRLHKSGFRYKLLRDPKIYFSVRRLRKEGRFNFVKRVVRAGIYYHFSESQENFKDIKLMNKKFGEHQFGKHL